MSSRTEEMDNFIKYLGTLDSFDEDRIYCELMEYGIQEDEKNSYASLSGKEKTNPKSFITEEREKVEYGYNNARMKESFAFWYYTDNESYTDYIWDFTTKFPNMIKLYIPARKENIQEVASTIFLLFNKYRVKHWSKIAAIVRSDDLVTRVSSYENVKNLIEFVNRELSDKVIKTNPFMIREGVVGISYDEEDFSYNDQVSIYLSEYLLKNQNDIESIGLSGFKTYMQELKEKAYTDKDYIKRTIKEKNESRKKRFFGSSDLMYLYNSAKIIELINIALDGEKGIEDFEEYWKTVIDSKEKQEKLDKIQVILKEIEEEKKKESNIDESEEKKKLIEGILKDQATIKEQNQEIEKLTSNLNKGDVTHEE